MTQKRWMILASAWVLVFVVFYMLVWRPNLSDIKQAQKNIRAAETQLVQLIRDVEKWPSTATRAKMENYEQRLEHLFSLVPLSEEVSQLLDRIQEEGVESVGLKFVSLEHDLSEQRQTTPNSPAGMTTGSPKPQNRKEIYTLVVEGKYVDLVQFLHDLENAPRLINVHQFVLKRVAETDIVQGTLTMNIFHTGSTS